MITRTLLMNTATPVVRALLSKYYGALTDQDLSLIRQLNRSPVHSCTSDIVYSRREEQIASSATVASLMTDIGNIVIADLIAATGLPHGKVVEGISLYATSSVETKPLWMIVCIILAMLDPLITVASLREISNGAVP